MTEKPEITIQIDHNSADIFNTGEPFEWWTAFVNLNDEYADCLWYGLCFDSYEDAENAAREYLRNLVQS
jgi:hypothetical protein